MAATVYSLRIVQKIFLGKNTNEQVLTDMSFREMLIALPMVAAILWLGLYPQPVLDRAKPSLDEQLEAYQKPAIKTGIPARVTMQILPPDTVKLLNTKGGIHALK